MAAKSKKRKLPADLQEAEALLLTTSSARRAVLEAYNSLQVVELNQVEGVLQTQALSPDALTTWLVAKYGIQEVQKMAKILVNLPETLTPSQKISSSYLVEIATVTSYVALSKDLHSVLLEAMTRMHHV